MSLTLPPLLCFCKLPDSMRLPVALYTVCPICSRSFALRNLPTVNTLPALSTINLLAGLYKHEWFI
ncbi:hypothetical protein SAMN04488126_102132 [Bhargavaea beijingensis]|uniref:Uncharacterized protein n=1 Tax=Bhargavaea beijingensis TaxID=426756 RepID=A0A1G6YYJ2_9BACL|nr:hypothetical protein SAMN04488126_102132 [Bhargavaea beijingensis]